MLLASDLRVKEMKYRALELLDPGLELSHNGEVYKCMYVHIYPTKPYVKIGFYLPFGPTSSHSFYAVVLILITPHRRAATELNRKQIYLFERS